MKGCLPNGRVPSRLATWRAGIVGLMIAFLQIDFTLTTFFSGRLNVSTYERSRLQNPEMLLVALGLDTTFTDLL